MKSQLSKSTVIILSLFLAVAFGCSKRATPSNVTQNTDEEVGWEDAGGTTFGSGSTKLGPIGGSGSGGSGTTLSGEQKTLLKELVSDDIASGAEPQFVNGQQTMSISLEDLAKFSPPELFVVYLYRRYLGRNPEPAGLKGWTAELKSNGPVSVVSGILASDEFYGHFGSDTAWVSALYYYLLGRTGDPEGLNNWVRALQSGTSRRDVVKGFLNSKEFLGMKGI